MGHCDCGSKSVVKNGLSRHGRQRWLCRECGRTFGETDHRRVSEAKKQSALAHYLEGVGLRATERLVGVSHNSVMNWVLEAVKGASLRAIAPEEVHWVEADELWTYVGKKNSKADSGGLLIVLPKRFAGGRWGIVAPKRPSDWMRSFLTPITSPTAQTSGIPTGKSLRPNSTCKAKHTRSR